MVSFDHRDPGTDESVWEAAGVRERGASWEPGPEIRHLVVLAAHPDDETLGAAGLLARAEAQGIRTSVVVATAGEGSHPDSSVRTRAELAAARRLELVEATAHAAPSAAVHLLGLGDGQLREQRDELVSSVASILAGMRGPTVVCAPWRGDGHRDHRILGEVAAALVDDDPRLRLLEYPVWAWHWADPREDDPLPWDRVVALHLTAQETAAKQRALRSHRSQVEPLSDRPGDEPVLHARMLAHFERDVEIFVDGEIRTTARDGASSLPAEFFDDFYSGRADPWGFETRWYEERKRALTLAALPRRRFASTLEVGCSTGVLTAELAGRSDRVLGIDIARAPLEVARRRLGPAVELGTFQTPHEWPTGRFDLVVLSEVGYYWGARDLELGIRRAVDSLTDDGVLVACHWRHPVPEYPTTGDEVHAALLTVSGLVTIARHEEEDFVLDVLVPPPGDSVARQEGLL
ncbi:PIG-L family deacetylase [Paraoerskovia marina]|uniref:PIG-L family deacetylase n=1 Tax=Paraoerskovia marina TaxID=545619 RepID=UPI000492A446|nr:PIG-L family deacetylase [Paraoerskovia marina]